MPNLNHKSFIREQLTNDLQQVDGLRAENKINLKTEDSCLFEIRLDICSFVLLSFFANL